MTAMNRKSLLALPLALTVLAAALAAAATALALLAPPALAQQAAASRLPPEVWTWGLVSAALATGLSSLAAGYAVAKLGTAAVGYQFGLTRRRGRAPGILLSILWCVIVTEIIDIGSARIWSFRTDTRVYEWSLDSLGLLPEAGGDQP